MSTVPVRRRSTITMAALVGLGLTAATLALGAGLVVGIMLCASGQLSIGALVAFFTSDWRRNRAEEEWPTLRFHAVREQHGLEEVRR